MHIARAVLVGALVLNAATTQAAVTTTVVDVPSGGATQRFLYLRPDAPVANIVAIPGNDGVLGIQNNGTMTTITALCDPVPRNRQAFPADGFSLALVDAKSNGVVWQSADILEVIRYMRDRDSVPTWVIGGSAASPAMVPIAASVPNSIPGGVIFDIPGFYDTSLAALISRPTLVMYHSQDPLAAQSQALFFQLAAAPVKELVILSGGTNDSGCPGPGGFHIYNGLDTEFVAAITGFIDKYNPPPTQVAKASAIEFFHADFRHYFITASTDEIAKLDNGTFAGWARTGQSFNVSTAGGAGRAPVCRFFTVAFPPSSSHFYAPRGFGCEGTLGNADWQFEGDVFFAALPDAAGACPPNHVPVYRLYNQGQGGAPNHRFTTSQQIQADMLAAGYLAEGAGIGIGMCSPQ